MRLLNQETKFLEKRLQVFLGGLLGVEALLIVQRFFSRRDEFRGSVIVLGFSNPFPCRSFHRGACPWLRFRYGTNRPPRDAISSWPGCGRGDHRELSGHLATNLERLVD